MGEVMARKVYFDTSALNRPFDDQAQARIRIEAEAVEHLLRAAGQGSLVWISSDLVLFEVSKCPDEERREMLRTLCRGASEHASLTGQVGNRARELRARGLRDLDALHLATAEEAGADVLVTTDDRFIRAVQALQPPSSVRVENPVVFELEVFR
jgi:predicted nucleic acid-binding protein